MFRVSPATSCLEPISHHIYQAYVPDHGTATPNYLVPKQKTDYAASGSLYGATCHTSYVVMLLVDTIVVYYELLVDSSYLTV